MKLGTLPFSELLTYSEDIYENTIITAKRARQIINDRANLTFAIQELENNWHPKYQSKLIGLLIEILKQSKEKSFILETHSELFILQIQKLVQKRIIKPDFVSINYISRSKNGESTIYNIPLNSQGGFTKPWPGGFFNERLEILRS